MEGAVHVCMAGPFPQGAWLPRPPLQEAKVTEEEGPRTARRVPGHCLALSCPHSAAYMRKGQASTSWPPWLSVWPPLCTTATNTAPRGTAIIV